MDCVISVTIDGGSEITIPLQSGMTLPTLRGTSTVSSANDARFNNDYRYMGYINQMFSLVFDSRQTTVAVPSGDMEISRVQLIITLVEPTALADNSNDFLINWKSRLNFNQDYSGGIYIEKIRNN